MRDIDKNRLIGNFKKPRAQRIKDRKEKSAVKRAKRPGNDLNHLKNIKRLPCIASERKYNVDPHHLKCMGGRGMGLTAPDQFLVPLNREYHDNLEISGSNNEIAWFSGYGIDCKKLAQDLWHARNNFPDMEAVWQKHWDRKSNNIQRNKQVSKS